MFHGWITRSAAALTLLLAIALAGCRQPKPEATPIGSGTLAVFFSPKGGCTEAVVSAIAAAQHTLDVQAYSFTSAPIVEAVAKAYARGVKVRVVLDKSQRAERYTAATYLLNHQVPAFIDDKHAIAHNKVMIIDGETVITGSFNFTKNAEQSNAENLLIIRGVKEIAQKYAANFEAHLSHAETYTGPTGGGGQTPDDQ